MFADLKASLLRMVFILILFASTLLQPLNARHMHHHYHHGHLHKGKTLSQQHGAFQGTLGKHRSLFNRQ